MLRCAQHVTLRTKCYVAHKMLRCAQNVSLRTKCYVARKMLRCARKLYVARANYTLRTKCSCLTSCAIWQENLDTISKPCYLACFSAWLIEPLSTDTRVLGSSLWSTLDDYTRSCGIYRQLCYRIIFFFILCRLQDGILLTISKTWMYRHCNVMVTQKICNWWLKVLLMISRRLVRLLKKENIVSNESHRRCEKCL